MKGSLYLFLQHQFDLAIVPSNHLQMQKQMDSGTLQFQVNKCKNYLVVITESAEKKT